MAITGTRLVDGLFIPLRGILVSSTISFTVMRGTVVAIAIAASIPDI
jgi:hypothetical protein